MQLSLLCPNNRVLGEVTAVRGDLRERCSFFRREVGMEEKGGSMFRVLVEWWKIVVEANQDF